MTEYIILAVLAVMLVLTVIIIIKLMTYIVSDQRNDDRVSDMLMDLHDKQISNQSEMLREITAIQSKSQTEMTDSMMRGFQMIQGTVNEKLDKSLNERLDSSFKQVGERLESLYRSLGELQKLESGVSSLNKTLSNVKSRGIYGEMQLGNILANLLDRSQYDENVPMKKNSDERVEFAIKIPDKDDNGFIYLPVDSKFPADIYNKIEDASEAGDADALKNAVKELQVRIRSEAMTIRDKYINPPQTTDFAVMFLPTEGLYAEVLRINGLVEECQQKYKIVISGPTTLTALINSLSVGFKYLTVNKKSEEIMKTLGQFKTQFETFDDLIAQTQKKLIEAQNKTELLAKRSEMVRKKLSKVEAVEAQDIVVDLLDENDF